MQYARSRSLSWIAGAAGFFLLPPDAALSMMSSIRMMVGGARPVSAAAAAARSRALVARADWVMSTGVAASAR